MSDARQIRAFVLLAAATLALAACSSSLDMIPEKLGGLPSDASRRPATTLPTPNVYEIRPKREERPLSDAEQKKLESDLWRCARTKSSAPTRLRRRHLRRLQKRQPPRIPARRRHRPRPKKSADR